MRKIVYFITVVALLYVANATIAYLDYPTPVDRSGKVKRAIVVGASSGMGRALAKLLAKDGYEVGLVARRVQMLHSLQEEIPTKTYVKLVDVTQADEAKVQLERLIEEMGGLDLMVVSVTAQGTVDQSKTTAEMSWDEVKQFVMIDTVGFWVAAHVGVKQFEKQGYGHLVGMSSIDSFFGSPYAPEYSGAKVYIARYLQGMRNRYIIKKKPIYFTEIYPGWVDVERKEYSTQPGTWWVASTDDAADQIFSAIKKKKERAYITKRWALIAFLFSLFPDWLYRRLDG